MGTKFIVKANPPSGPVSQEVELNNLVGEESLIGAATQILQSVARSGLVIEEKGGVTFYPPGLLGAVFCAPILIPPPLQVTPGTEKGLHRIK